MAWCLWKKGRNRLIIAFWATIFLCFVLYDEEVFDEAQYLLSRGTEIHRQRFMPTEDLMSSYHLQQPLRKNKTIILVWWAMFGWANSFNITTDECIVTFDRSSIDVAKAIVFHFAEVGDTPKRLPHDKRSDNQRWIWWCLEPPWNTKYVFRKNINKLDGVFNWTMTYRTDSDVHFPYGNEKLDGRENSTVAEMIKHKTSPSLGIWIVSNCKASSRGRLIKQLQRYITIDVWGKCVGRTLCRGGCALQEIKRYKFIFSFENSRCGDYITEKFLTNGLLGGAVPVVMGPPRKDYEKLAPPHSFIHVDDFQSVEELANYLRQLDKDDSKYGEYLKWKSLPESAENTPAKGFHLQYFGWNNLCKKLMETGPSERSIVNNLDTWWYGEEHVSGSSSFPMCNPEDGPSGYSLHWHLVAAYSLFIILCCLSTLKCCSNLSSR